MNADSTMSDCPFCTESMTWSNVLQCVRMELFPAISVKISECVQEKLLMDSSFKMTDIGKEAVMDVIERLKEKRTMNNVEVSYLLRLFNRANDHRMMNTGLLRDSMVKFEKLVLQIENSNRISAQIYGIDAILLTYSVPIACWSE